MPVNLDPNTTKYMIRAKVRADGVIQKPDVVGAVFGQTEGLLGADLDMRDLQKAARIGRIEVEINDKKGKSEGTIFVPSSLDKVETAILAAALESIDRVGPCKARIEVERIEDVRSSRRDHIVSRAKELLHGILEDEASDSSMLTDEVRTAVQVAEITQWGPDKLWAGPGVVGGDDLILVEGRNDVVNLLRCGIRNALSVEGTNVPDSVVEISKERVTTIFIDGDRGGELIARELLTSAEVDYVARAPPTREVEELPHKLVMKALNNKMPAEQYAESVGLRVKKGKKPAKAEKVEKASKAEKPAKREEREPREAREPRRERTRGRSRSRDREERDEDEDRADRRDRRRAEPRGRGRGEERDEGEERGGRPERTERAERTERPARAERSEGGRGRDRDRGDRGDRGGKREKKPLPPELVAYRDILGSVSGSLKAVLLDKDGKEVAKDIAVRDLADTLKSSKDDVAAVVFDGVITQRLLDIATDRNIETVVGVKVGNVTNKPEKVHVVTKGELE